MFNEGEESGSGTIEVYRFVSCAFCKCRIVEFYISEFLEREVSCTANPFADFLEVIFGVYARNDRGAEFIVGATLHDNANALLEATDIDIGIAGGEWIFLRRVFDIHRPKVYELGLGDFPDNIRENTIGVELHQKAHIFYLSNEIEKISVECRFATRDTDTVEFASSFLEKIQKFIGLVATRFRKVLFARLYELGVVAERASQDTAERKHRRGEFAGVVEECEWLVAGDIHNAMGLQF